MAGIEITDLGKWFEHRVALEGLNLSIADGETFGVLGPLGSGRSTTIRILATLSSPTRGDALVCGHSVTREPERVRKIIGFQPSFFGHYEYMRVWEYLEFFSRAFHLDLETRRDSVERLLAQAGLADQVNEFINALDREAKQRLGLVKALMHDPPVLLLDEPMAGLAPPARTRMRNLIGQARRPGRIIVISTNILSDLVGLCERAALLCQGRLMMLESTESLVQRLADARFLEVETQGDAAGAKHVVKQHPAVRFADAHGEFLVFTVDGSLTDPFVLIDWLRQKGVLVNAYREHEVDLEYLTTTESASENAGKDREPIP